ncbi:MAG: TauD/TfdA family dioxygenase [Acidobacteriota bacterium]|nr:TauD/TfdA family dioxygenase [Acidobacteriota bacterium]
MILKNDAELVSKTYIEADKHFPLVIKPNQSDVDLAAWAGANVDMLEAELLNHGAVLLRGFGVASTGQFSKFANAVCELYGEYGDLPPENPEQKVYQSTPYRADKMILFHNESSHMHQWPSRQFFYCVTAAEEGGETPLVDCRKLYRALPAELAKLFEEKGLLYVRNFIPGLDVSWQNFFKTENRAEVETYCRNAGIHFEWQDRGGLKTMQKAPAVITHPQTGEKCFFNQIQLHHVSYLDKRVRAALTRVYGEEGLPRNVFLGDGSPLTDDIMETVNRLYDTHAAAYAWEVGDVIMLDNMLVAHARNPFKGPRKITVAMGKLVQAGDILSNSPLAS